MELKEATITLSTAAASLAAEVEYRGLAAQMEIHRGARGEDAWTNLVLAFEETRLEQLTELVCDTSLAGFVVPAAAILVCDRDLELATADLPELVQKTLFPDAEPGTKQMIRAGASLAFRLDPSTLGRSGNDLQVALAHALSRLGLEDPFVAAMSLPNDATQPTEVSLEFRVHDTGLLDGLTRSLKQFLVDGWVGAGQLADALAEGSPRHFTSLACQTGRKPFAGEFSNSKVCKTFIAPYHSAHGAIASMYVQVYFALHLLGGSSEKVAYNNASRPVHGQAQFRYWKSGSLQGTPNGK